MTVDEFLTQVTRLEIAARSLGFSPSVSARINTALLQALAEKRQMDCPHTETHNFGHTHAAGRDDVTVCKECGKEIERKPL